MVPKRVNNTLDQGTITVRDTSAEMDFPGIQTLSSRHCFHR